MEFKAHQTIEGERPGTVGTADPRFYADFPLKKSILRQAPPPLGNGESTPAALRSCIPFNVEAF